MQTSRPHDLVGRSADVAALHRLVEAGRAVTLIGPGGVGKTRLALEFAARLRQDGQRIGVVELAAVTGADRVAQAVSTSLELRSAPYDSAAAMIAEWAQAKPALIVLDNCEHLGDVPASIVFDVLSCSANVAVLATSREPLRLSGEQLYDVNPLSTTGGSVPDAAQLFVDRARLVAPTLKPSAAQWRSIIEITSWLDGMPLAIEMAASRARHTGLAELAEAVRDDLSLLAIDAVNAPTRQRTMQACIDWSFRQLDPSLQQVLMPLSVFEGLFDLADARAVLPPELSTSAVITLLGGLVDRSLLQRDGDNTEPGYRMLHTIRTFARQHSSAQSSSTAHRRHMEHFAALCDRGGVGLETSEQPHWLTTLSAYASDIDSAMRFAAANGEAHALWQMCGSLTFVWVAAGRFAEATRWFASCCEVLDVPIATQLPARWGAAHLAVYSGEIEHALELARETRTLAAQIGATTYVARANNTIGVGGMFTQRTQAREALQASIEASKQVDDWCHVDSSQVLAYIDLQEFRVDEALRGLESVRPLVERLRHPPLLAWDWLGRYQAAAIRGDVGEARTIESEAIQHVAAAGDVSISALMVATQAQIAQREGRARDTLEDVERSLEKCGAQGAESAALALIGVLIDACLTLDDLNRARELLDGAEPDIDRTAPDATLGLHIQRCRLALAVGDLPAAEAALVRAQRMAERHGTAPGLAVVHCWKAFVAVCAEQPTIAWRSALAAWSVLRAERLDGHAIGSLRVMAICCAAFDDPPGAARLLGAADSMAQRIGLVDEPCGSMFAESITDLISANDGVLNAARARGQTLDADAAFASVARSTGPRRRPSSGWDGLTPAERQVATLVAEGLTNRQTAERLFIGAGTVKTHLEHAYAKLGVRNRTELTAAFHRNHHS